MARRPRDRRGWPGPERPANRGGFYSYQRLENLAGCRIRNVDRLLPDLPRLSVGAHVYLFTQMAPYDVVACDPPRALVLFQLIDPRTREPLLTDELRPRAWFSSVWAFHLAGADRDGTPLVVRGMADYGGGLGNAVTMAFVGPIAHVRGIG